MALSHASLGHIAPRIQIAYYKTLKARFNGIRNESRFQR
jgi:hypothetical protein